LTVVVVIAEFSATTSILETIYTHKRGMRLFFFCILLILIFFLKNKKKSREIHRIIEHFYKSHLIIYKTTGFCFVSIVEYKSDMKKEQK
jgi:hypothetical protein